MKKYLIVLGLSLFTAAGARSAGNTLVSIVKGADSEDRAVSAFSAISSSGSYNVTVTMGAKESLRIEGDPDDLKEIETVVENGVLKIRNKQRNKPWNLRINMQKVNVYVTAKTLNSIVLSGSGNIKVNGKVKADKLSTNVSGSGNISLEADAGTFISVISGSGDLKVGGTANSVTVTVSGSGDFDGRSLRAESASIRVSGSGGAAIHADKMLDAKVSGSGSVRYAGNARVTQTKSGSGRVARL